MEITTKISISLLSRMKIMRKAKYRCAVCLGINHKEGYYNALGMFIECDSHMRDWAVRQGLKLIRISLQIVSAPPECSIKKIQSYAVLCRKDAMKLKNDIRELKKQASKKSG